MEIKNICVVGLGYVGLPLAVELSKHFNVVGFDVNKERILKLNNCSDEICEVDSKKLESENIIFTSNSEKIKGNEIIIACVPTPIDENNKPDLSFLENVSKTIGKNMSKDSIVVYESTVYPGVTQEICIPILEESSGMKCKEGFKVGYSPERINPGDKEHSIDKVTKIVSGIDDESLSAIDYVYSRITKTHLAPSIKVAEGAKVIENIQRDLNIALMNELVIVFDKMNVDVHAVLEAAGTKWNFHKYTPGLVGGHCFEKNSMIFLMNNGHQKIKKIGDYIDSLDCKKQVVRDTEIFYPQNVGILSYDMVKNKTLFKPVSLASKRKTNEILNIKCVYNYNLEVTNRHPVIVHNGGLEIKFAQDIKVGDKLILNKILPVKKRNHTIDILEHLDKEMYNKVRVKVKGEKISNFREIINKHIKGKKGNYYNWDYLPLEKYLLIEKKLGISRKNIYLCTGRGLSLRKFPCIFKIDNDFMRLVGYYLSEGCITKDKSLRTRFTFHRGEKEYQNDVIDILKKYGLEYSIYHDKTYQATTIKVSSYFFGFLLKDILNCGTNCYTMQIPEILFDFIKKAKEELLKGLFRGDGGVTWYNKERTYQKNGKKFTHKNNSICISYFTSSPVLFQQVLLLLLNQDFFPKLAKRKGYLTLLGHDDVKKVKNWFLGDKKEKVENYLKNKQNKTKYPYAEKCNNYVAINIIDIKKKKTDYVYSLEVDDTHTLITTNGIIAHNCIGVDPYYLTHKAKEFGYTPEVILAGRKINDNMHKYYAEKIIKLLNKKDSKSILLLGLAFKPNVSDYRNSRVKQLIKELQNNQIDVFAYDPFIDKEIVENHFSAKYLDPFNEKIDVGLIVKTTEHDKLLNWGKDFGKEVLSLRNL